MRRAPWLVAMACVMVGAGRARAQELVSGPLTLDFTGRIQIQFNTTSVDADDLGLAEAPASSTFEQRRLRLGVNLAYDAWLTGKLEADVAGGRTRVTDAFVDFGLSPAAQLMVGQFKKPFSLIELTSSTQTLTIERGERIRGLDDLLGAVPPEAYVLLDASGYVGREIGAALHGAAGPVEYAAGVFNGTGQDAADTDGAKAYAARVVLTPSARVPLRLGGAVSVQDAEGAGADAVRGTAWELDVEWGAFRAPLHVQAELVFGDNRAAAGGDPLVAASDMLGAQLAATWFRALAHERAEGIELVGRVSWGEPDTDVHDDHGWLLTPGLNLYFTGRNRLMLNWDLFLPAAAGFDTEHALRAQAQLYF